MRADSTHDGAGLDSGLFLARTLGSRGAALLGAGDVAAITAASTEQPFAAGTVLFAQGDVPGSVHVVRSGEVDLVRADGRRRVTLDIARAGDVVGDEAAILGRPHRYGATGRGQGRTIRFDATALHDVLRGHHAVALRWLTAIAQRADRFAERLLEVANLGLRARIVTYLDDQIRAGRGMGDGVIELSQETLASIVGASRQSVNRTLGELRRDGYLEAGYGRITVRDPQRLRDALD